MLSRFAGGCTSRCQLTDAVAIAMALTLLPVAANSGAAMMIPCQAESGSHNNGFMDSYTSFRQGKQCLKA